jgi:hypothetical protein
LPGETDELDEFDGGGGTGCAFENSIEPKRINAANNL